MNTALVWWLAGALAAALAVAAGGALVVLVRRMANRFVVPRPYALMPEFEIVAVRGGRSGAAAGDAPGTLTVVVPAPAIDAPQHAKTRAVGAYGLVWEGGHGVLGEVLADDGTRVERPLTVIEGSPPRPGAAARMDAFYYRRDPLRDHEIGFEDLRLQGPVGALAAWFVPAAGSTGVLLLHGRRRGERSETLRAMPTLHALDMPVLALSYRNHDASDPSPDGLYHYGASEWQDALVGASALAERGVTRIVAFGMSMGGAVALEAWKRWPSELPPLVALVLEAPLVDPAAAVRLAVRRAGVPFAAWAARAATRAARLRTGVDFASLLQARRAHEIDVPILLVAGTADTTVPIDAIDRFAERIRAPLVYRRIEGVEHVEAWNAGPAAYDAALRAFLAGVAEGADGGDGGDAGGHEPAAAPPGRGLSAGRSA
ncbi:MAG: hypothetical protein R6W77_09945 [Trueperaceae bacterium]